MSAKKQQEPKSRPFPWLCSDCVTRTVVPTVIDFTAKVKHDGVIHELHLPGIEVPRCQTCGDLVITTAIDERVNDALRSKLHLLTPAQIRANIDKLDLNQQELAEWLDVAPETVSRWMTGALIQSSRMNTRLRLFFASPETRKMLRRLHEDLQLGMEVRLSSDEGQDCARLRFLTPAQIREGIKQLEPKLNQQQLAERLGVAAETISRWLTGALIQSRAMDNFLRVYFAFPEVQDALSGASQDPQLGLLTPTHSDNYPELG